MSTQVSEMIKVGSVVLEGEVLDTYVSAKSANREGVNPRPFVLQGEKQRFLNKEAKDTFLESHYKTDKPLQLENLSRVKVHTEGFNETLDKISVISRESTELRTAVEKADKELESSQKSDSSPVAAVVDHPSTPFNLSTVMSEARKVSGRELPTECILVREYDRVDREYSGDEDRYYADGNKKIHRHQWEILHITEGTVESGVQIGELKKLWYKFNAAASEGRRLYPDLPVYRYRNGRVVKVRKIK